jgi:hypothetical protein
MVYCCSSRYGESEQNLMHQSMCDCRIFPAEAGNLNDRGPHFGTHCRATGRGTIAGRQYFATITLGHIRARIAYGVTTA